MTRKLFPILLAIAVGTGAAYANDGRDNLIADAGDTSTPRHAPVRIAQGPQPPKPPKPPKPPQAPHITINGNTIDLSGIEGMVRGQLAGVREMIRNNANIPQPLRDKLLARLDKVNASVDKRLAKIKTKGLDHLGEEMEALGDEIENALDGLDQDLEALGDKASKDIGKKLKNKSLKFDFGNKDDEDDNETPEAGDPADGIPMAPDLDDASSDDMRDALNDLKGMAITPQQKEQISKIRENSDKAVGTAKKQIDDLSKKLETALGDPKTSNADIERMVDEISRQEATIRKARIIAWHNARRVLDDGQRKRIEAAARKKNH